MQPDNKTREELIQENNRLKAKILEMEQKTSSGSSQTDEIKNAYEAIKQERELYLSLLNALPIGVYKVQNIPSKVISQNFQDSKDSPYVVKLVNDILCEILQIKKSDIEKNPAIIHDFVVQEDKDEFARKNMEAITNKSNFIWEGRLKINGEIKWMHFESRPQKGKNNTTCWTGILYDITKRKQIEESLEESKNIFEQLFIQSATSTQLLDPEGWCIRVNPKLSELFGVKPENIEGKKYNILQDGEIIKTGVINHLRKVFEHKETARWEVNFDIGHASETTGVEVTKPEKRWFNNIAYPILNANQEIKYVIIQHEDITEQKNAIEALKKSEKKFRNIFTLSPLGKSMTGIDGTLSVNNAFCEMLGYTEEELKSKHWKEITHPDDIQKSGTIAQSLAEEKIERASYEKRYIHKNGNIIWADVIIGTIKDSSGKPEFFTTTIRDITEQKKVKSKIERLSRIFEDTLNEIYLFNANDLKFIQLNQAALKNLGYTMDELTNMTPFDIKPEISEQLFKKLIQPLKSGEKEKIIFETVHQRKDKSLYHVEVHLQLLKHEGETLFYAIISDITERKHAEEELLNSLKREQIQADIVRNTPVAIAFGYPDGSLGNCNKAFSDLTGYTEEELLHINWNEVLTPSKWRELETEKLQQLTPENNDLRYEKEYIHKNGNIIPVELVVTAKFDNHHNIIHYIGFVTDITKRKQIEEELRKYRENLEDLVKERTIELENKNKELDNAMKVFVGRELTIRNLQERIRALEGK